LSSDHLSNFEISELLCLEAEQVKQPLQKAMRRAGRKAFLWPQEASSIVEAGESLEQLPGIGPFLAKVIKRWLNNPPDVPTPPEIRQNFLTLTQAQSILKSKAAKTLTTTTIGAIKGDLQMHTLWSDGEGSIREMADAGIARGYQYISITDHSKGLKIAGGINEAELQQQAEEIAAVNSDLSADGHSFRVLHSIELNLNPSGEGDMDEESLSRLDLVLGCFHSSLRKKDDQTGRFLAALRNPSIQILGHPRGRIFNFRLGLTADWSQVFDLAAELDKAVEIDGYPDRQDLSVDLLRLAKRSGCRISLGTDSHGPSQLRFMDFSLAAAISAGIPRERILNFMEADQLLAWASQLRRN
jgi:histidinol phosphatase-like PHP family hydrolase